MERRDPPAASGFLCAGCNREIEVGDRYIEDTPSGFMASWGKVPASAPELDGIMANILGGVGGRVAYCEDCTSPGGDYLFETYYGDDDAAS